VFADFYLKGLEKSPAHEQYLTNSWADYVELLCLASVDNEISEDDVVDRLTGRIKDLKEASDKDLEEIEDLENETNDGIEPSRRAELSDRWSTKVRDYFEVLYLRQSLYENSYPFEIEGNCLKRKNQLTEKQLLYIYLLLCSNLYLFDDTTRGDLANYFELISLNEFKNILPSNAMIFLFGKNPHNKRSRYSSVKFWNKLNRLRRDINEERNPHLKRVEFPEQHTGDEGLDIVGWIPTGDQLPSSLIYFAQCACTYNFVEKQHSSSYVAWSQKITFKNPPSNSTFIPHCFRRADGTWIRSSHIMYTFLIDRKRIIHYYTDSEKIKFSALPIYDLVNEIVGLKESVV
jgi:hypothetical protein